MLTVLVGVLPAFMKGYTYAAAGASTSIPSINAPSATFSHIGDNGVSGIVNTITKFGGWLLLIAGALAVVMVVIGGLRYMTSMGNSQQAEAAKKTITYAIIGLIVIVLSAFIVRLTIFIANSLSKPQAVQSIETNIKNGTLKGRVSSCIYQSKMVYNVPLSPTATPESYSSELLDDQGQHLCYTGGGFTGQGDISAHCPGFDPSKCPAY